MGQPSRIAATVTGAVIVAGLAVGVVATRRELTADEQAAEAVGVDVSTRRRDECRIKVSPEGDCRRVVRAMPDLKPTLVDPGVDNVMRPLEWVGRDCVPASCAKGGGP